MRQRSSLSILSFVLISFSIAYVSAQTRLCIQNRKNFIPNSKYNENRHSILSSLPSNDAAKDGFYSGSFGQEPNRIYTVGMCIPGSTPGDCSDCLKSASDWLKQSCPNQTDAFYWSLSPTTCLIRYSNSSFSGSADY
ncbi:hypothetical protein N665_0612s0003 [Sinapis alba]|nr:hypothetical protein N665_0612s0003 [Sinapis alba]